jgi:hypothetical protein
MSRLDRCQVWDIMLAQRDIARNAGSIPPRTFARRRLVELTAAKPWANRHDWCGRVDAYQRIARGLTSHVELQRNP